MKYVAPAVDAITGELLIPPLAAEEFYAALHDRLLDHWPRAQSLTHARESGNRLRNNIIQRTHTPDLGDPRMVGWTYLVASDDPDRATIADTLAPLARHRGMAEEQPLIFAGEPPDRWQDWIERQYSALHGAPQYVLIIGGPDRVPFQFQAVLSSAAAVGRLAFDDIAELRTYVDKVLRLETAAVASTEKHALIFATDRGNPDPTYYSRRFMATPIRDHLRTSGIAARSLFGPEASAANLRSALTTERFAVVYTATHGAARPRADLTMQRETNGAIVCTPEPGATAQSLFAARDVPADDTPVAEGAVVFAFGCYTAGTPAHSDYAHWLGRELPAGKADFVAALPNRLLAHPRGPVAFVGHVDLAWLDAYDDPDEPELTTLWHPRLLPFRNAVETFLAPQPVGLGMAALNKRFDIGNAGLANAVDRRQRGVPEDAADQRLLARAFIARSDAQNYIVLGDPAAYPRMRAISPCGS